MTITVIRRQPQGTGGVEPLLWDTAAGVPTSLPPIAPMHRGRATSPFHRPGRIDERKEGGWRMSTDLPRGKTRSLAATLPVAYRSTAPSW